MSSYFLRTGRVLGAAALVQTRKADCVCSTTGSWFAGRTFCFASWACELLTVKRLAPCAATWALSVVEEQEPPALAVYIRVSLHDAYSFWRWETTDGLENSISLYRIFWRSNSDISVFMSHFNTCISLCTFIEKRVSPWIPFILNFVVSEWPLAALERLPLAVFQSSDFFSQLLDCLSIWSPKVRRGKKKKKQAQQKLYSKLLWSSFFFPFVATGGQWRGGRYFSLSLGKMRKSQPHTTYVGHATTEGRISLCPCPIKKRAKLAHSNI